MHQAPSIYAVNFFCSSQLMINHSRRINPSLTVDTLPAQMNPTLVKSPSSFSFFHSFFLPSAHTKAGFGWHSVPGCHIDGVKFDMKWTATSCHKMSIYQIHSCFIGSTAPNMLQCLSLLCTGHMALLNCLVFFLYPVASWTVVFVPLLPSKEEKKHVLWPKAFSHQFSCTLNGTERLLDFIWLWFYSVLPLPNRTVLFQWRIFAVPRKGTKKESLTETKGVHAIESQPPRHSLSHPQTHFRSTYWQKKEMFRRTN